MTEQRDGQEREWVSLPDGKAMPVWALWIELTEVTEQQPDLPIDDAIRKARDLYVERHYQ